MKRSRIGIPALLAVLVLGALALWPAYVRRQSDGAHAAGLPTAAPVIADYTERDRTIAFWQGMVRKHLTEDMLSPRKLAEQYLQRYRERGDIGDVLRAEAAAKTSLAVMPRHNMAAELQLASVYLTLHRFHDALALTRDVASYDRGDPGIGVREATLEMEIGEYDAARTELDAVPLKSRDDAWRVVESRYLELTGHLAQARDLLDRAAAYQNAVLDVPAQSRAWYDFRQGEMAFEAGDNDAALAHERHALEIFPAFADASRALARFECALKQWPACLADATRSANEVPYPETLGYEVDAQRALGDPSAAARTDDLIRTVEKIGNAQHISDRLLAIYYSEHRERTADAYAIARRELTVRDDILTQDTLAWAAAMDGRWDVARAASARALRFDTEMSLLQYHAGVIAQHFGERDAAKRRFERALALNPSFHAVYADDARARLAAL